MNDLGKLAQNISVLHRQFYKDMNDKYKKYSLNPTAACILLMVDENPEIIQKEICDNLVIDKALATREINKMTQLDYIEKKLDLDARSYCRQENKDKKLHLKLEH